MKFSRVIEIIIVLNVTGLFSFFAPPAGVKIWVITAVMMTLFGLYITFNIFSLIKMMSITRILVMQFNIVLVWPLLTGLYSNFVTLDAVLYVVFPFFLISASAILVFRNGIKVMNRIILISIALTGIGALANIFFPDYFIAVGILADTNVFDQKGRISGFLMQPNSFGMVSVILLIGYLLVQQPSNFDIVFYIVFMSTLFCILLSGSRSALIAVGLVACFYYYNLIRNGINSSSSVIIKNILFLVLSLFIAGTLTFSLQEEITSIMGSSQLFDRIELYFSGKLSDSDELSQDGSVATRIEAQSYYWKRLSDNPIFGYGIGADLAYRQTPEFFLTAHSDALRLAVEYGSIYCIFFFWLLLAVSLEIARLWNSKILSLIYFAPLSFLYLFGGNLLDLRLFYLFLGMLTGYFASIKNLSVQA